MDRDSLKLFLDQGLSLEEIGRRVGRHPSTVGYWLKKHNLVAAQRQRHLARGEISREALEGLVQEGATYAFMAKALGVSPATIRYWLRKHGLETDRGKRIRLGRAELTAGTEIAQLVCRTHGLTDFRLDRRSVYRCRRCRVEAVTRRREAVRDTLIAEAGGACVVCGYNAYVGALHFHHLDPSAKEFGIRGGATPSLARLRVEAQKCVLLCANCHAEVEGGARTLPAKVLRAIKIGADRTNNPA